MIDIKNKAALSLLSVFVSISLLFHFSAKAKPRAEDFPFKAAAGLKGKLPPDFELKLAGGERWRLSENIGGKVIILNFFATWCGPCKMEMPELNRFYEANKSAPFVMIGINADESEEKVREFVREFDVKFPVGIDEHERTQKLYNVKSYPTTLVIGADGRVGIVETGPVLNADIVFGSFLGENLALIKAGKHIGKDAYLAALKKLPPEKAEKEEDETKLLSGRELQIAKKMACPCGCSDMLMECGCSTAKRIRKKLKGMDMKDKTDGDVIKELNNEFCVRHDNN